MEYPTTTALSTIKAEFFVASETTKKAIWLWRLLKEINKNQDDPLPILCDYDSAIKLVKNNSIRGPSTLRFDTILFERNKKLERLKSPLYRQKTTRQIASQSLSQILDGINLRSRLGILEVPFISCFV